MPATETVAEKSFRFAAGSAPPSPAREDRPAWVTLRSFILGTLGVILVCTLVPYNDYIVVNTFLVGSYMPVVLVLAFFVLTAAINAPLRRFVPSLALSSGEMAVVLLMMLVACSLPSQGLLRTFIPAQVAPFYFGSQDERFWRAFTSMGLPDWLYPVGHIADGRSSSIMLDFYSRVDDGAAIPYGAWVLSLTVWGVFAFALFSTLVGLSLILRKQWAEVERLPFPIARVELSLIEPPAPGRAFNELLSSRGCWLAMLSVFLIQSSLALHAYFPRYVPALPVKYNFEDVLTAAPWAHFSGFIKRNQLYFTVIGLTYFIPLRTAFSLWAVFIACQCFNVSYRMQQSEITGASWLDQHLAACATYLIGVVWIGRLHWVRVLRLSIGRGRPGDERGDQASYRLGFYLWAGGLVVMLGWLMFMGVSPLMALLIVAIMLMAHVVVTRVVAETGMPLFRVMATSTQIFDQFSPAHFRMNDLYFAGVFTQNGVDTTRESLLGFAMHGQAVLAGTNVSRRAARGVVWLIGWCLVVGYVSGAWASLRCYYTYSGPTSAIANDNLENRHGLIISPKRDYVDAMNAFAGGRFKPRQSDTVKHLAIGAGVTVALQVCAMRWTWWPIMPVGYVVQQSWFVQTSWYSIFLGWLAKALIVRFGGAGLFKRARPVFMGLILGECLAAGVWLVVNLLLAAGGHDFIQINFLPS